MWEGKFTEELSQLFDKYEELFDGMPPDEYDEIDYNDMEYDEFVGYIKECIKKKKVMDKIID